MPYINIAVKTARPPITIRYNELTDKQLLTKRRDLFDGHYRNRLDSFDGGGPATSQQWQFRKNGRSLTVEVWHHRAYKYVPDIKKQMKLIVEKFLEHNMFRMMTSFLERKLVVYLDAERAGGAGYVVADPARPNPQMKLFVTCVSNIMTQTNIVAYRFSKGSGNLVYMIRAYLLHEFGHIMHQLMNPSYYYGLNDCIACRGGMLDNRRLFFAGTPSNQTFNNMTYYSGLAAAYGDELSSYGCSNGLEFVAESFSALMTGQTLSDACIDQYRFFGGPDIVHRSGMLNHTVN